MFQFRRFPTYTYLIQCTFRRSSLRGFPHSEIHGSMDICSSPWLIAACRVLLRRSVPRHSPCALSSLTFRRRRLRTARCSPLPPQAFVGSPRREDAVIRFLLHLLSEKIWFSCLNYAGITKKSFFRNCNCYPSSLRCCSTIKILFFRNLLRKTSLLPYFIFITHYSVFKVHLPALLKPDRNTHSRECFDLISNLVENSGIEPLTS
jgi:hypothetical protein